jgi:hypothetical protein
MKKSESLACPVYEHGGQKIFRGSSVNKKITLRREFMKSILVGLLAISFAVVVQAKNNNKTPTPRAPASADSGIGLDTLAAQLAGTYAAHDDCRERAFGGEKSSKGPVTIAVEASRPDAIVLSYDYARSRGDKPQSERDHVRGGLIEINQVSALQAIQIQDGTVTGRIQRASGRVAGGATAVGEAPVLGSLVSNNSSAWKDVNLSIDEQGNIQFSGGGCDADVRLERQLVGNQ